MPDDAQITVQVFAEIEDRLFPLLGLDVWERSLYYYLLRHTRLLGVTSVSVGMAAVSKGSGMSEMKARESLRSMDKKGCIRIEDRNRKGHVVRVLLPDEIDRVRDVPVEGVVNLDDVDFYTDRRHLPAILRRDKDECFYCGRSVNPKTVVLDHVVADANGGDNSHRNIVSSCHECNSRKQATAADDFMRSLYRRGVLSQDELPTRLDLLARLAAGELPIVVDA